MSIVARIVQRLGFVRTARYAASLQQQLKAEARSAHMADRLARAQSAASALKQRSDHLSQSLKQTRDDGRRAKGDLARAQRDVARGLQDLERAQKENARLRAQLLPFKERLAAAERALVVARETLMTVETKLDILEGAAQVLDRRTRVDAAEGASRSSASV